MAISKSPLGINARNFLYIRHLNSVKAKRLADDKVATKNLLISSRIPTTKLLAVFPKRESIRNFDWKQLPTGFAIKPARGYGGQGILVFKYWSGEAGLTISGKEYTIRNLESHLFDIMDGVYSLQYLPDIPFIEELVTPQSFFRKIAPIGLPDIRVIVFNRVPVMAMLRLPTEKSGGKANLLLGALGVGIGLRTGITIQAITEQSRLSPIEVKYIPGTKIKVRGIKIPSWDEILLLASKTAIVSKLGYVGVDIVVDEKKGPLVLEINARPGLGIQLANKASLRTRLERLEGVVVNTPERGVELAKSLFAEAQLDIVETKPKVLSVIEDVIFEINGEEKIVAAKLDTGAYRTSLDQDLVSELGLIPIKRSILVKAASGQQLRKAVKIDFFLSGKKISTIATIADRGHLQYPLIVGRRNLKGFLINPETTKEKEDKSQEDELDA